MISLGDSGILPNQIEELEDIGVDKGATKKNQKRKTGWGPILRAPRPRRGHEDGRTMLEKAQDLKKVKNLEKGTYPKNSFASENNIALLNKARCVNISLGIDTSTANDTIDSLKLKELEDRTIFEEKNPEVNLPSSLDVEVTVEDFPPLTSSSCTLLKDVGDVVPDS